MIFFYFIIFADRLKHILISKNVGSFGSIVWTQENATSIFLGKVVIV